MPKDREPSLEGRLNDESSEGEEAAIEKWRLPTLEQILMQEESKLAMRKIGVNWNSFVKIKHKNYLEDYIFQK